MKQVAGLRLMAEGNRQQATGLRLKEESEQEDQMIDLDIQRQMWENHLLGYQLYKDRKSIEDFVYFQHVMQNFTIVKEAVESSLGEVLPIEDYQPLVSVVFGGDNCTDDVSIVVPDFVLLGGNRFLIFEMVLHEAIKKDYDQLEFYIDWFRKNPQSEGEIVASLISAKISDKMIEYGDEHNINSIQIETTAKFSRSSSH